MGDDVGEERLDHGLEVDDGSGDVAGLVGCEVGGGVRGGRGGLEVVA